MRRAGAVIVACVFALTVAAPSYAYTRPASVSGMTSAEKAAAKARILHWADAGLTDDAYAGLGEAAIAGGVETSGITLATAVPGVMVGAGAIYGAYQVGTYFRKLISEDASPDYGSSINWITGYSWVYTTSANALGQNPYYKLVLQDPGTDPDPALCPGYSFSATLMAWGDGLGGSTWVDASSGGCHHEYRSKNYMSQRLKAVPITGSAYAALPSGQKLGAVGGSPVVDQPIPDDTALQCALDSINYFGPNTNCGGHPHTNAQDTPAGAAVDTAMPSTFGAPDCDSLTLSACQALWTAAGSTVTVTSTTASLSGAVVTKPAGSVISQSPAAGATVPTPGTAVTVTVNPANNDMPFRVFRPLVGETYTAYLARLAAAGWVGIVTYVDLDGSTGDPDIGPDGVPRVGVQLDGSGTAVQYLLKSWPTTLPRTTRGAPLIVSRNPHDFPPVDPEPAPADPAAPGPPPIGGGGGGSCPCPIHALDFSPLSFTGTCTKFPFGVFCWIGDQLATFFGVGAVAPSVTWPAITMTAPVFGDIVFPSFTLDAATLPPAFGTFFGIMRLALGFFVWLGGLWWLGQRIIFKSANLGDGPSTDAGTET